MPRRRRSSNGHGAPRRAERTHRSRRRRRSPRWRDWLWLMIGLTVLFGVGAIVRMVGRIFW